MKIPTRSIWQFVLVSLLILSLLLGQNRITGRVTQDIDSSIVWIGDESLLAAQGHIVALNLSRYFRSNDPLTFVAARPANADAWVAGDMLYISPTGAYTGQDVFSLSASDGFRVLSVPLDLTIAAQASSQELILANSPIPIDPVVLDQIDLNDEYPVSVNITASFDLSSYTEFQEVAIDGIAMPGSYDLKDAVLVGDVLHGKVTRRGLTALVSDPQVTSISSITSRKIPFMKRAGGPRISAVPVGYPKAPRADTSFGIQKFMVASTTDMNISTTNTEQTRLKLIANPVNNSFLVLWEDYRVSADVDIVGQIINGSGNLTGFQNETTIADTNSVQALAAGAFSESSLSYLIAYSNITEPVAAFTTEMMYITVLNESGGRRNNAFVLTDQFNRSQNHPAVAWNPDNDTFMVVWVNDSIMTLSGVFNDTEEDTLVGILINSTGSPVSRNFTIRDGNSNIVLSNITDPTGNTQVQRTYDSFLSPAIAYGTWNNTFLVTWQDNSTGTFDLFGAILNSNGSLNVSLITIASGAAHQISSQIVYDNVSNRFLVVFDNCTDVTPEGSAGCDTYGYLITGEGALFGAQININNKENETGFPSVAFSPQSNQFVVSYLDCSTSEPRCFVVSQVINGTGSLVGIPSIVQKIANTAENLPKIAYSNKDNRFYAAYIDNRTNTPNNHIYGNFLARYEPQTTNFTVGNGTTSFNSSPDLTNVTLGVIQNSLGRIKYNRSINVSGQNLDRHIAMGLRFLSLNSTALDPSLNGTANVSINVTSCTGGDLLYKTGFFTSQASAVNDSRMCKPTTDPSCTNIVCQAGLLNFTVSHFTSYAYGLNSNLTIFDDQDAIKGSQARNPGDAFAFYANYTQPDGTAISSAVCEIFINTSTPIIWNMSYNVTSSLYQFNTTAIPDKSAYMWNATCNATNSGFSLLTANDTMILAVFVNCTQIGTNSIVNITCLNSFKITINETGSNNTNSTLDTINANFSVFDNSYVNNSNVWSSNKTNSWVVNSTDIFSWVNQSVELNSYLASCRVQNSSISNSSKTNSTVIASFNINAAVNTSFENTCHITNGRMEYSNCTNSTLAQSYTYFTNISNAWSLNSTQTQCLVRNVTMHSSVCINSTKQDVQVHNSTNINSTVSNATEFNCTLVNVVFQNRNCTNSIFNGSPISDCTIVNNVILLGSSCLNSTKDNVTAIQSVNNNTVVNQTVEDNCRILGGRFLGGNCTNSTKVTTYSTYSNNSNSSTLNFTEDICWVRDGLIHNSVCGNTTIRGAVVHNSTDFNSTFTNGTQINCTLVDTVLNNQDCINMVLNVTYLDNCTITNSTLVNSTCYNSTVTNTQKYTSVDNNSQVNLSIENYCRMENTTSIVSNCTNSSSTNGFLTYTHINNSISNGTNATSCFINGELLHTSFCIRSNKTQGVSIISNNTNSTAVNATEIGCQLINTVMYNSTCINSTKTNSFIRNSFNRDAYINNVTETGCTLINITLQHTTCTNNTFINNVPNATAVNTTINNSPNIYNCTLTNSNLFNSTCINSTLNNVTKIDSNDYNSTSNASTELGCTLINTFLQNSTCWNSTKIWTNVTFSSNINSTINMTAESFCAVQNSSLLRGSCYNSTVNATNTVNCTITQSFVTGGFCVNSTKLNSSVYYSNNTNSSANQSVEAACQLINSRLINSTCVNTSIIASPVINSNLTNVTANNSVLFNCTLNNSILQLMRCYHNVLTPITTPRVIFLSPVAGRIINQSDRLNITINATDPDGIDIVSVTITLPDLTTQTHILESTGVDYYTTFFNVTNLTGAYIVQADVNDSVDSRNQSIQTNFSINANLTIFDDNDPQRDILWPRFNQTVIFFANYTNISQMPIIGAGVLCELRLNVTGAFPINMTYNASMSLYQINHTIGQNGTFLWNVTCDGSSQGLSRVWRNDTITIQNNIFNSTTSNCNIDSRSQLLGSNCSNSNVTNTSKINSINQNSTLNNSDEFNCIANNTIMQTSNCTNSTKAFTVLINSTDNDSVVYISNETGCIVTGSFLNLTNCLFSNKTDVFAQNSFNNGSTIRNGTEINANKSQVISINSSNYNSTLTQTNETNCYVAGSVITGSICLNSTIINTTKTQSLDNNSVVNWSIERNCTLQGGLLYFSNCTNSTKIESIVQQSNDNSSVVYYSNETSCNVLSSRLNTSTCNNATIVNSTVIRTIANLSTINSSSIVNCTLINSVLQFVNCSNATLINVTAFNSTIIDSFKFNVSIINSSNINSRVNHSTEIVSRIVNTTAVGMTANESLITNTFDNQVAFDNTTANIGTIYNATITDSNLSRVNISRSNVSNSNITAATLQNVSVITRSTIVDSTFGNSTAQESVKYNATVVNSDNNNVTLQNVSESNASVCFVARSNVNYSNTDNCTLPVSAGASRGSGGGPHINVPYVRMPGPAEASSPMTSAFTQGNMLTGSLGQAGQTNPAANPQAPQPKKPAAPANNGATFLPTPPPMPPSSGGLITTSPLIERPLEVPPAGISFIWYILLFLVLLLGGYDMYIYEKRKKTSGSK